MTDRPDVELHARYPLADTTTAADLAELLLTVPADARISFLVPIPSFQSYADTPPPQQPRSLTATWTVPAGQPLTPPNTDDVPAAGWAVPMVGVDVAGCAAVEGGRCRCSIVPVVTAVLGSDAAPSGPLPPACAACGRSGDDPCVGSLTGEAIPTKYLNRVHAEADAQHAASEARREAIRTEARRRFDDPIAMGGTGL